MAVILGWGWSNGLNHRAIELQIDSPGAPVLLLIWVAAVFVSILVHELGHTIAFKYYGIDSHILLYHFGGLAIPGSFGSWNAARQRSIGPQENIVISAAGPAAQLLLAAIVIAIGLGLSVPMSVLGFSFPGSPPSAITTYAILDAILYPSVFWALLNLAPILPLDGGQIARSALILFGVQSPQRAAYMLSVGTGAVMGLFFMSRGNTFAGLMFFMFAANNWQAMQYGGGAY